MDQRDHIIDQKGQNMYENRQKNRVFGLKNLTKNHPAKKPLSEMGGTPPSLNGQNPLSSF